MPREVHFAYIVPTSYSGQSTASEMIIQQLERRGWVCHRLPVFPLNRGIASPVKRGVDLIRRQWETWRSFAAAGLKGNVVLHLNLGQSLSSFARAGLPLLLLKIMARSVHVVVSLHGSVFMQWSTTQIEARILKAFLQSAQLVTVLGEGQRRRLLQWELDSAKVRVVRNTCDIETISEEDVRIKHETNDPIRILHLSLLIESKGYPEFLEAVSALAAQDRESALEAVLCGPFSYTTYCSRFTNDEIKRAWIEQTIKRINDQSDSAVKVKWIPGADGEAKRKLFEDAHIFVFPSRFPVEAQPLVLLEAMAAGCAIITSDVGEIPSTVNSDSAIQLHDPQSVDLSATIDRLIANQAQRVDMALEGIRLMNTRFSMPRHVDTWEEIFATLSPQPAKLEPCI